MSEPQEGLLWPHCNFRPLPPISLSYFFFHCTFYHIVQLSNLQFLLPLPTLNKILEGRELLFSLFTTAILVFRIILKYFLRLLCPWDSPGNDTGVGCHFLLQGIFPTQGLSPCLFCLLRLTVEFFITSATWEVYVHIFYQNRHVYI